LERHHRQIGELDLGLAISIVLRYATHKQTDVADNGTADDGGAVLVEEGG
jgi:hypothetical protein